MFVGARRALLSVPAVVAAADYSTEAQQFFDRITDPGDTRKDVYATLIDGLEADGLWAKLDALWMFAADITGNAVVNLKSSSFTASLVNSPTFTADEGYTGNGSTSYVSSTYTPSTAGGNYTQNSAAFGVYIRTDRATGSAFNDMGVQTTAGGSKVSDLIPRWTDGNCYYTLNAATGGAFVNTGANSVRGFRALSRVGSTLATPYKNGTAVEAGDAATSSGLPAVAFYIGAKNNAGTAANFSTDQIAASFIAGGLDATENSNLASRINAYMTSLGKNVY